MLGIESQHLFNEAIEFLTLILIIERYLTINRSILTNGKGFQVDQTLPKRVRRKTKKERKTYKSAEAQGIKKPELNSGFRSSLR